MDTEEKSKGRTGCLCWFIPLLLPFLLCAALFFTDEFQNTFYKARSFVAGIIARLDRPDEETEHLKIQSLNNIRSLEDELRTLMPAKPYIVISVTDNSFSLRKTNGDTIRTGLCSTGKDNILIKGDKRWVFKTPRGVFTVLDKRRSPVWTKPDWAFIEEGLHVPPARSPKRLDTNTLGDYALGIGDGYFIHGTLYQRRIGLPETHGCVRVGDADLEAIFNTLSVRSKVFIY